MAGCLELPQHGVGLRDYLGAVELLLAHGADPGRARFPMGTWLGTGHPAQKTESLLEGGERLQRDKIRHSIQRSAIMARLRDHMDLPIDAMLPLNANALYLEQVKDQ